MFAAVIVATLLPSPASAELRMGITPSKVHLSVEPGGMHTTAVELSNRGANPVRVTTSVVDWTTPREGGMTFLPPGEIDRSASGWVFVDLSEFILPPHGSQIVRVTAALPDTAVGSYWTLLFFEGEGEARRGGINVGAKVRMGTTVYLTAAGTEEREDALTGMKVEASAASDTLQLVTSLANRGNAYYYPEGWFQVLDAGGEILFEEKVPLRVLLPHRETEYRIPWRPESPGEYRLVATFDSGVETLMQGIKSFAVPVAPVEAPSVEEPPEEEEPPAAVDRRLAELSNDARPVVPPAPPAVPAPSAPATRFAPPARSASPAIVDEPAVVASPHRYGVHVESFAYGTEAATASRVYAAAAYPVTVKIVDLAEKGVWYRVIVGSFAAREEARAAALALRKAFDLNYASIVGLDP